jgi:hypothetical protein
MTEPTHDLRPDVSAQLDIVLARVMLHVGIDDLEIARETLRDALSDSWHHGWMSGHDDGVERRRPVSENPYHRRPATPAGGNAAENAANSDAIS